MLLKKSEIVGNNDIRINQLLWKMPQWKINGASKSRLVTLKTRESGDGELWKSWNALKLPVEPRLSQETGTHTSSAVVSVRGKG